MLYVSTHYGTVRTLVQWLREKRDRQRARKRERGRGEREVREREIIYTYAHHVWLHVYTHMYI